LFVAGFRRFPGKALSLQPLVIFPEAVRLLSVEGAPSQAPLRLPCSEIWLISPEKLVGGSAMVSTLKAPTLEISLIEKIKAKIKKRAEAKAKRMLLKRPKGLGKRSG
jgi:hypothetical protein